MEDPEVVEEFVTDQDVKLLRLRTVLGDYGPYVSYLNPVEVLSGSRRIGWASLEFRSTVSTVLMANLVLDAATPERLDIEAGDRHLYARLEGVCVLDAEPFEHIGLVHGLLPDLRSIEVLGLQISDAPGVEDQPRLGEHQL